MTDVNVEEQIARWRGYVERHAGIAADDVAEMEDHLRAQVLDLAAVGLSDAEAFLVALGRLGDMNEISREFAREHADRLWKQMAIGSTSSKASSTTGRRPPRELVVALILAAGAAVAVKIGLTVVHDTRFALTASLFVTPFLAGYFAWQRRLAARQIVVVAVIFGLLATVLGAYPFSEAGDTAVLAVIHGPIVAWLLVGVAYIGGPWRSGARRMDFIRFTGEFIVYYVLIALGGGALVGLTIGSFAAVGVQASGFIGEWVLPMAIPGAALIAAWLVEAKQNVVENIAPVLTRVFIPLTIIMLLALMAAYAAGGGASDPSRALLIMMDLVLVLVLGLLIYTISARDSSAPVGVFDWLQLILVIAALAADALVLVAMVSRIAQFGWSPNKIAALGINLILLVNLVGSAWLGLQLVRGGRASGALENWQTRYLPVFGAWAAAVVVALPPIFDFA
jgi:hypothetical protein